MSLSHLPSVLQKSIIIKLYYNVVTTATTGKVPLTIAVMPQRILFSLGYHSHERVVTKDYKK